MIAAMVPLSPDILAEAVVPLALLLLLAAAVSDVAFRRIPNRIAALVALVGLLRQGLAGGGAVGIALPLAAMVFLGGVLLWLRGALGGGDVKLLAAAALLVPPASVPAQLLAVALGLLPCCISACARCCLRRGPMAGRAAGCVAPCGARRGASGLARRCPMASPSPSAPRSS